MFADDSAGLREGQGRLAKNSDHLGDSFDTDNTGGLLSGLLAEEDDLDRRALWRIGSWGVGAVAAVVVAVMANQSSLGLKREQMAAAELSRQAQQIQLAARENQSETRRLANAVDTLNGDRDRLYSRVTSLEQGLDSVTGSFIRQLPPNAPVTPPTLPAIDPCRAGDRARGGAGRDRCSGDRKAGDQDAGAEPRHRLRGCQGPAEDGARQG